MRICCLSLSLMTAILSGCCGCVRFPHYHYTSPVQAELEAGPVGVGPIIDCILDAHDMAVLRICAPTTARRIELHQHLRLEDIEKMSRLRISDEKIIATIDETGSIYHLRYSDIEDLEDGGVSDFVIDYMLFTGTRVLIPC